MGNGTITAEAIIRHVEGLAGHRLNPDEGVQHGDARAEGPGATVCWMATPGAIEAAGRAGHRLVVCHESLYYPYNASNRTGTPQEWEAWKVNRGRRELLEKHSLACLRIHGSADEICIFDAFAEILGLGAPARENGFVKVYEIPPRPLGDLARQVMERTGMAALRVAPARGMDQVVGRVGLAWGGMGLDSNVGYQQKLVEAGCDVLVAGESDNYGFRFAVESGIPMIETSHEISENPGLRRLAEMLSAAFPGADFRFHENDCAWNFFRAGTGPEGRSPGAAGRDGK